MVMLPFPVWWQMVTIWLFPFPFPLPFPAIKVAFWYARIRVGCANNEFAANVIINKAIRELNFVFMMLRLGFAFLTQMQQIRLQSYA
jgi:hypothetical protein